MGLDFKNHLGQLKHPLFQLCFSIVRKKPTSLDFSNDFSSLVLISPHPPSAKMVFAFPVYKLCTAHKCYEVAQIQYKRNWSSIDDNSKNGANWNQYNIKKRLYQLISNFGEHSLSILELCRAKTSCIYPNPPSYSAVKHTAASTMSSSAEWQPSKSIEVNRIYGCQLTHFFAIFTPLFIPQLKNTQLLPFRSN